MKPASNKPANQLDGQPDDQPHEEYGMPCAEALLASTLALMTGHAQACCDSHKAAMAGKTAASLLVLSQHSRMSPGFRELAQRLQDRWAVEALPAQADTSSPNSPRALWHTTPEVIQ